MAGQQTNNGGAEDSGPDAIKPTTGAAAHGASQDAQAKGRPEAAHGNPETTANVLAASTPVAALIRAAADGELSAESAPDQAAAFARLEKLLNDATAAEAAGAARAGDRIAFERALRPACGQCLRDMAGAPGEAFRARIAAMAVGTGDAAPAPALVTAAPGSIAEPAHIHEPADRARQGERAIPGRAPAGARRAAPGRRLAMSLGASAILVFAAFAVYQAVINTGTVNNTPETLTASLASFMTAEHERTALDSDAAKAKFRCTDPQRVCDEYSGTLGASPALPELGGEHNLAFQGAGPCGVPGGPSIHARFYTRTEADGCPHEMSLFVQRDDGRLDLEEDKVYTLECEAASVEVWRRGSLIYYLVSDNNADCDCFRRAAGVGEPTGVVRVKQG